MPVLDEEIYKGLADFRSCQFFGHSLSKEYNDSVVELYQWNVRRKKNVCWTLTPALAPGASVNAERANRRMLRQSRCDGSAQACGWFDFKGIFVSTKSLRN
jgi:hypothetical protein